MFGAKKDSMTIKENQTVLLNCQLNDEKYTYLIEYDKDDKNCKRVTLLRYN